MNILSVTKDEYNKIVINPFSGFDTLKFVELNKHKIDKVKYFIFNNGKNRFGLVAGIKDNVLQCPFSATFGIFSEIILNNKIEYYYDANHYIYLFTDAEIAYLELEDQSSSKNKLFKGEIQSLKNQYFVWLVATFHLN